jgi:putative DNA-invertase from lambdoid prophage Rac
VGQVDGYQRVSSTQQVEGNSQETQGKQIQAYTASKGWAVPDENIFVEAGISGGIDFCDLSVDPTL